MDWSKARLTGYVTSFLAAVASLMVVMGYATFDRETMVLDIAPINIAWVAGVIAGPLAPLVATVAIWFGWKPLK